MTYTDYKIVCERSLKDLELRVREKVQIGWKPHGPVTTIDRTPHIGKKQIEYVQIIVKVEE